MLHNRVSGRSYRFSSNAHHFIALMDGRRTVEELWQASGDALGDEGLTQEEVVGLLRRLYSADLLQSDTSTDAHVQDASPEEEAVLVHHAIQCEQSTMVN